MHLSPKNLEQKLFKLYVTDMKPKPDICKELGISYKKLKILTEFLDADVYRRQKVREKRVKRFIEWRKECKNNLKWKKQNVAL